MQQPSAPAQVGILDGRSAQHDAPQLPGALEAAPQLGQALLGLRAEGLAGRRRLQRGIVQAHA